MYYRQMKTTLGHRYKVRTAEDPTLERILFGLAVTVLPFAATVGMMLIWMKGV